MQNYQLFWNDQISGEGQGQLVVDWDVFIKNFTEAIYRYTHLQLNTIQKQYIKSKIDPMNSNQIYKNAFLLFAKTYWDLPSNRTNLFKMKINLSTLTRLNLITGSQCQTIKIKFRYKSTQSKLTQLKYLYKEDRLYELDVDGFQKTQKAVIQNGFISFGSSLKNDIQIQDSLFVNKHQLKLISVKKQVKIKKKNIFEEKQPAPIYLTEWFIRDTARSNRITYQLDNPFKYIIVKPGMVIRFGFTNNFELRIAKIGYNTGNISIGAKTLQQMTNLLNNDRINIMGQIDQNVPLKTLLDFDFREINTKEIEQLYQHGQYYPEERDVPVEKKLPNDKSATSFVFQIVNKRTFQEIQYNTGIQTTICVGRGHDCHFRINDISVRKKELIFQAINGIWTVRNAELQQNVSLQKGSCGINLASFKNIQEKRNSNRIQLKQGYPYLLRGKDFQCEVELIEPKQPEQEF